MGGGPKKVFRADDEAASEIRERQATLTDEAALEEARLLSIPSNPPFDSAVALRRRLAPMTRVPTLEGSLADLAADPRTAFVLGFVDGLLPLETIVDVAGLPEQETLAILERAITNNVIVFREPPPSRR